MSRTGPVTKDTSVVALGLAQIRVGASATNINSIQPVLVPADSIGALANTKFTGSVDYWRLESGFPMMEDLVIPLREKAQLECAFKELSPKNMAMAKGIDSTTGYDLAHSGEVGLGQIVAPDYVRMEAFYTYPDGLNEMVIILPRSQVTSNFEVDLKAEDAAAIAITFEGKRADSEVAGGSSVWDNKTLGRILFRAKP